MNRYADRFPEDENNKVGLPLSTYDYELHPCGPADAEKPPVHEIDARLAAEPMASYLKDHYYWTDSQGRRHGHFNWKEYWYHLPAEIFTGFTPDELSRLVFSSVVMSEVSEMMEANPRYRLLWKIRNCMWHWGWAPDYNLFVRAYSAIRRFDFGVEGFETYLDHTTYCNEVGYSQYARKFLDGVFAYMIHHKGEHVMTIGFSVSRRGLLISQIQLAKPKGNRWLYRLPCHYIDHAVNRLADAYCGWKLLFIDGSWLAAAIKRSYGRNADQFTDEKYEHVAKVYSRRLADWRRAGYCRVRQHRYHYLHAKVDAA